MNETKAEDLSIDPDEMEELLEEKAAMKRNRGPRHGRARRFIGAPLAFVKDVCLLTEGRAALVVAQLIYRRVSICAYRTVTLPSIELAELDIGRSLKREALIRLQDAGLIKVENAKGQTARITLLWRQSQPSAGEDTECRL